jgi:hypothetical protein
MMLKDQTHIKRNCLSIGIISSNLQSGCYNNQLADIYTKPLDEKTFRKLRNELNILDSRNFD